jgi:hypothetical protein
MDKLIFKSNDALKKLAVGTCKHDRFNIPYTRETDNEKSFLLVKDDGLYLMPSFSLKKGTPTSENVTVYAEGYDPKTNPDCWDDCYRVSADDFAERIPLNAKMLLNLSRGGDLIIYLSDTEIRVEA